MVVIYNLGDRLKYLRESIDLKQKDVALKLKINNKTLSNYENNVSSPDPNTIRLLCEFYKVTSDYLLGLTDQKQGFMKNTYQDESNPIPFHENSNQYKTKNDLTQNINRILTEEEEKIIKYYNRLNEENKDSIKGSMVNLYKEQIKSEQSKK